MAVDMFIKIGDIKGESADDKHKGEIDILSWSWGASQTGTMHTGTGGGAGKVHVQDLTFHKYVDLSSPTLFIDMCKGTHIKNATLTVRKAGDKPLEYLVLELNNVLVSSISTGGSGGGDRVTEQVTLNFSEFKYHYSQQDEKGAGKPAAIVGWNIAKNIPA